MMKKLASAFPKINADLTAADILDQCDRWVPVNALVGAAIEAHRLAFQDRGQPLRASYALRAVTLACTPTPDDCRQMLDYLTALPIEAWQGETIEVYSAQEWRDDTLRNISRSLAWMLER